MFQTQLSNNIAVLRERKKLTQQELGAALNLPTKVIEAWESGLSIPNDANVTKLANVFGVSVPTLVKGSFTQSILAPAPTPIGPAATMGNPRVYERPVGVSKAMFILLWISCGGLIGGMLGTFLFALYAPFLATLCSIILLLSPIVQSVALILFVLCKKTATQNVFLRGLGYAVIILYYIWQIVSWCLGRAQIQEIWTIALDLITSTLFIVTLFILFENKPRGYGSKKPTVCLKAAVICAAGSILCLALMFENLVFSLFGLLLEYAFVVLLAFAKEDKMIISQYK